MTSRAGMFLWTITGLLFAAAAPAQDTASCRYVREVMAGGGGEEHAAVTLDSVLWDSLQAGAADLRVVGSDGRAVPYLLRKALRKERQTERIPCASRMTAFRELPGNQAEIALSLETNAPAADGIVFDSPLKDFERRLSVRGIGADGSEGLLVEEALIFDYSRFIDMRNLSVTLPPNDFRRFLVRVNTVTDEAQSPRRQLERTFEGGAEVRLEEASVVTDRPLRLDKVTFYHARKTEGWRGERQADYGPKNWTLREDPRSQQTLIEIETFNEPLTSLVVETDGRNFSRLATVQVPVREGGLETWREVGKSGISRVAYREFKCEALGISFPEMASRRYRIVIDNHDSPPVTVAGVHGVGPVWQAVFMAEPAARYTLYYGGPETRPPVYDTDSLQRVLGKEYDPVDRPLGPQASNPGFRRQGVGLGRFVGSRGFFLLVVVAMVAALAFGLVRAAKKMGATGE
jgi:hypothetical protein